MLKDLKLPKNQRKYSIFAQKRQTSDGHIFLFIFAFRNGGRVSGKMSTHFVRIDVFFVFVAFSFYYKPHSAKHFERLLAEFVCARIVALSKQTNSVKRRQKAKQPSRRT
jgi:hypothetical protein